MSVHIAALMNIILTGMVKALPEAREDLLGYFNLKYPCTLALSPQRGEGIMFFKEK